MTQPDHFEQIAKQALSRWLDSPLHESSNTMYAKLLRRQHATVRRLVKQLMTQRMLDYERETLDEKRTAHSKTDASIRGWAVKDMRDDLLAAMDKMAGKKGQP